MKVHPDEQAWREVRCAVHFRQLARRTDISPYTRTIYRMAMTEHAMEAARRIRIWRVISRGRGDRELAHGQAPMEAVGVGGRFSCGQAERSTLNIQHPTSKGAVTT